MTWRDAQIEQLFAHSRALADRPVSLAFESRAAIPGSYLWVIPNAGHAPASGDGAPRFAETATSFVRGGWKRAS
jgi:pimeloyl-ACP methyl ester carboxylesterase